MPTMSWWGYPILCPKCQKAPTLQSFEFSADGECRLTYACTTCKQDIYWKVFASQLQHIARSNDLEKHCRKCHKGVVTAPLALPKPPDDFETFMKGLGAE